MGRPRSFSEDDAVAAAQALFATHGYAGTSVDDLVRATGVGRASLYSVFGSKDGLFRRCVDQALATVAAADAPAQALDLLLVALMESAPDDVALARAVRDGLKTAGLTATDLGERLLARASNRR